MSNTFWTSDLHFGHKNLVFEYSKDARLNDQGHSFESTDEHDQTLIDRWNSVVKPDDAVWVLGDIVINKRNLHKVEKLNGRKLLVMGNHDNFKQDVCFGELFGPNRFQRPFGCAEKRFGSLRTIMTHIPVHPSQFYRYDFNLHGHLHDKKVMDIHNPDIEDLRYVNLSMEHWNMTPVSFDQLNKELQRRAEILRIN